MPPKSPSAPLPSPVPIGISPNVWIFHVKGSGAERSSAPLVFLCEPPVRLWDPLIILLFPNRSAVLDCILHRVPGNLFPDESLYGALLWRLAPQPMDDILVCMDIQLHVETHRVFLSYFACVFVRASMESSQSLISASLMIDIYLPPWKMSSFPCTVFVHVHAASLNPVRRMGIPVYYGFCLDAFP